MKNTMKNLINIAAIIVMVLTSATVEGHSQTRQDYTYDDAGTCVIGCCDQWEHDAYDLLHLRQPQ